MKTTAFVCKTCRKEFEEPETASLCFETEKPTYYKAIPVCPHCRSTAFEEKKPPVTRQELSQYKYLKKELDREEEKLSKKRPGTDSYAKYYELVENNRLRCMALLIKLQSFIYSIDDSLMRQIFDMRYIQGEPWSKISAELGGYLSSDYVRIMHDRYLDKLNK